MWICEKCNEENEDSFDSCWKCQTHSDIGSEKSKVHQHTVKEEELEKETTINKEIKNEGRKNIIWPLVIFIGISLSIGPRLYNMYLEKEYEELTKDYILNFNPMTGEMEYNSQEYFDSIRSVNIKLRTKKMFDSLRSIEMKEVDIEKYGFDYGPEVPNIKVDFKDKDGKVIE